MNYDISLLNFLFCSRESEFPKIRREKRRCLPITSTEDLCPGLAALPRPLQDLLCSSECQAGGYQAKLALVASVLLGEAEGELGYRKDPASERNLACAM